MKTFKEARAELLGLIADNAEDEKLIRALYYFAIGYLGKIKALDRLPSDQSAREFVQDQDNTDSGSCQQGGSHV